MFQQHLAIFHKSRPSAGVVPTPMALSDYKLSRTGGQNGGQKIIWGGGHLPPLAPPPPAPPLYIMLHGTTLNINFKFDWFVLHLKVVRCNTA